MSLTIAMRLAVISEIWASCYAGGYSDGFAALYAYERGLREALAMVGGK